MKLIQWIFSWFRRSSPPTKSHEAHTIHLEPKYWPEVTDYIHNLSNIVKCNTIEDDNIQQVNERILSYVLDQINKKGSIDDFETRYLALQTLADRILLIELGKIVGLKHNAGTTAQFSEATQLFKKRLMMRRESEMASNPLL